MIITTVGEARKAIKAAKSVYVEARLGCVEKSVKVTKAEAMWLLEGLAASDTGEDISTSTGSIARVEGDTVTIG